MSVVDRYRIEPGSRVNLKKFQTDDDGGLSKEEARDQFTRLEQRLAELQELLYASCRHSLLIVLQAMDAGGKDSTIRSVFGAFNPQGCRVVSFKAPTEEERRHDFLWRIHQQVPPLGWVTVFNRSHYEDVLIVRVKNLVPEECWRRRYKQINAFEELLTSEGTVMIKFFLHISREYQKERLLRRLADPTKHWKFDPADLAERKRWDDYQAAYAEALERCSTRYAPWYVIPAEKRWFRDWLIARIIVETLENLDMRYPTPTFDPAAIVIE